MPGEANCLYTKILIPFVEREVGPEGVATLLRAAGRSREYLMADHNWLPVSLMTELITLAREMMGEPDEERWVRRAADFGMDWKPSREERSYLGTYSMGIGSPREIYRRMELFYRQVARFATLEVVRIGRTRARLRWTPEPGLRIPRWACGWLQVTLERFPTNWGLPRARIVEPHCAARGADACIYDIAWKNPPLGRRFWAPMITGAAGSLALWFGLAVEAPVSWLADGTVAAFPALLGGTLGYALVERYRQHRTERLLHLQAEEVIYSNNELEKKFRDLEAKIEQLSLLIDLSAAVHGTLDPEKIYEQALQRLVDRMGYEAAHLFLVDERRRTLVGRRMAGGDPGASRAFEGIELPLVPVQSAVATVAVSGLPLKVDDVESGSEPVNLAMARSLDVRSLLAVPLRVKRGVIGVVSVLSKDTRRFAEADVELLSAVANQVAIAVDRAESFRTIEELSRDLEDKVRVRTEQLRTANEDLQAAYRDLQATQMQLIQREKMASIGQLVAGVAHELNNPIGFVSSNATTLEDFVKRLRSMLETYRALELPAADRVRVDEQWAALKVDYALKYLDSMIQGIREGAERTRKIVRDLRVFARGQDEVWQAVNLHEELESSLTLLNHLLKDRVVISRKYGELGSVECIRSQIDQVFLNLLANAAQAIAGPGEITIETGETDGHAVVTIRDTGPGIPAEILGRIFDPFFTTKPVGEGTGLGLSISYEIVKKHGGDITAASLPVGGAVFTVRVPIARVVSVSA